MAVQFETLEHPPIREALIDARIAPLGQDAVADLSLEPHELPGEFCRREEQKAFSGHFGVNDGKLGKPEATDHGIVGYHYVDAGRTEVAQFRLDGFTYNRLAPYAGWGALVKRGIELLSVYRGRVKSAEFIRLAVRYINEVGLAGEADLSLWLSDPPAASKEAGRELSGYRVRREYSGPRQGAGVNVTIAVDGPLGAPSSTLIVDIEAYLADADVSSEGGLNCTLDELRDAKNRFFFGSLTPRAIQRHK